ncbi:unnamed protein product [Triticum turgidum subsp. durum]|uniref:Uncharacterized protein n=1 Tax=Triticum turgidum subsp. durum TaxID=4567 RepID=A0A9R1BE50_TRITD|nr:unnamed protein product [Triticum turgidum subsp. durum]
MPRKPKVSSSRFIHGGEVQKRKGLRWIPRHPETRKGVASDEMLRGVENKHRSGDSQIGQPFKLPAESMSRQETT